MKENAEDLLAFQIKAAGLPEPVRQYYYARPRRFRADFSWPSRRVLVACDGGVYNRRAHGSVSGILADIERQNVAAVHGYFTLRVTPQMIKSGVAIKLIEEMLEAPWRIQTSEPWMK